MKFYKLLVVLLMMSFFSCKKEYTLQEKERIEDLRASHVYKYKVPNDAFVFCLDTIKADSEYQKFSKEFCDRGIGKESYIYLSSYKVYIPVFVEYGCGTIGCYLKCNTLTINVNKGSQWLVNDELISDFSQIKMDVIIADYFNDMEKKDRGNKSLIRFNSRAIKNNRKRDSLYMNLVTSYYNYIKVKKKETSKDIDDLTKNHSFNLLFEQEVEFLIPPPPPPIKQEIFEVDKEME